MIKIFTADQRFISSQDTHEIKSLLNYGVHYAAHRQAVGDLLYVNEWSGSVNTTLSIPSFGAHVVMLIPLQESFVLSCADKEVLLEVGQVLLLDISKVENIILLPQVEFGQSYVIHQFVFQSALLWEVSLVIQNLPIFDEKQRNSILPVFEIPNTRFQLYAGAFVGKEEFNLSLMNAVKYTLVSVLSGTFEVEERLLFTGDYLLLEDMEMINVESLAETGIIMVLSY